MGDEAKVNVERDLGAGCDKGRNFVFLDPDEPNEDEEDFAGNESS
jgi:hypothetical protein